MLLTADYSQIELRLLAHFSGDPLLVDAYRRWVLPLVLQALGDGTVGMADLFYSMGRANPGALILHNYPDWMRHLRRRKGSGDVDEIIDLAAIDILRDRERGVPRYNRFRELFHLPRVKSFEQLTSNPQWARELEEVR